MYFRNYGLRNTLLDNCLERPVIQDLSTGNNGKWSETLLQSYLLI